MSQCVFCEIVATRTDPELAVFEDEHVIAQISLAHKPRNRGHVLVIPKTHIRDIYDLPQELNAPLMSALRLLSRAAKKAFSAEGIHIRQNNEPAAGQDVFHLHFHVIPRYDGDEFDTKKYEKLSLQERKELSERLRLAVQCEMRDA
ncbi:MAG: HIT family protein [Candidatus Sabulitectum sp.]|nr:HIT family protein [Candidatus Sabulitectum sp.]